MRLQPVAFANFRFLVGRACKGPSLSSNFLGGRSLCYLILAPTEFFSRATFSSEFLWGAGFL